MVGAFAPYIIKRRRAEIVRGYCYRFLQCSFPCGIIMLIFSILFILLGAGQLIYILHFNGCNPVITTASESSTTKQFLVTSSSPPPPPPALLPLFKCNRATMKVLGITFLVTGIVLFVISVLVTKYSRSSEENNVIRTTTSSLLSSSSSSSHPTKATSKHHHHPPHPICHYSLTPLSSMHDLSHATLSTR